ncbi:tripartite tricarboxylate transporter substrate binding protein [Actinobaculum suis]|uniref:tripartite tricarboxylate transporter substrate binding protein n=1 Tax=Actinobaculum suis TaxID=1657 RepID=UPI000A82C143|nr:tripartite tricarboxylate transporter substrate binding protein [Actinobaculum suis]
MKKRVLKAMAVLSSAALLLSACGGKATNEASSNGGDGGSTHKCDVAPGYPKGPIEIIVPFSAGGGTDQVARSLANELSQDLGVQVNVVNRTGGGGVVGHQAMAASKPDGQTLGLVTAEIAMMHWQDLTDLTPEGLQAVSQVNEDSAAITVSASSEYKTIEDLINAIKANPGKLNASGTVQGGIGHLAMLGLLMEAGIDTNDVTWVPSDGAAPAVQELTAGGVDFIVTSSIGEVRTMVDSGELRTLAIMGTEKDENYPDVPLLSDYGYKYTGGTWRGIVVPKGTDEKIVKALDCRIADIVKRDAFVEVMDASAFKIKYRSTDEFTKFMTEADAAYGPLMKEAGLAK